MEKSYTDDMVANRRHLHKRPEEGWTEFETTYFVYQYLTALGLPVSVGKANINEKEVLGRDEKLVADGIEQIFCSDACYQHGKAWLIRLWVNQHEAAKA